jgi:hypothetical protein
MSYDRTERTFPWIIVTVFLAGAVLVGLGIVMGSLWVAIAGAVTVVVAGLGGAILPRFGLSAPLSFSVNYPESAGAEGAPSNDDHDERSYDELPEVPARRLPSGPDRERAKPQHVNLGPHEHLRVSGGEEVIEVPEKERED